MSQPSGAQRVDNLNKAYLGNPLLPLRGLLYLDGYGDVVSQVGKAERVFCASQIPEMINLLRARKYLVTRASTKRNARLQSEDLKGK